MKKLFFPALMLIASACSGDYDNYGEGKGSISVRGEKDLHMDAVDTRESVSLTDFTGYTLILEGPDAMQIECPADGMVGDVTAGNYTVTLTNFANAYVPSFNDPRYSGSTQVTVAGGATAEAYLTLIQANAGVMFLLDKSLEGTVLQNVIPRIEQGAATLIYNDITDVGYYSPGTVLVTLMNGEVPVVVNGNTSIPLDLKARELWSITLKIAPNTGGLEITAEIDVTVIGKEQDAILDLPEIGDGGSLTITGLEGQTVTVTMNDGPVYQISLNSSGTGLFRGDGLIRTITLANDHVIFIGRYADEDIELNVENGALALRTAAADGIPVGTYSELQLISQNLSADYSQQADIDLLSLNWNPIVAYELKGEGEPEPQPFRGTYEGNGFSISNFVIDADQTHAGFFAYLSGNVSNLNFVSGLIKSTAAYVGVLAGESSSAGQIRIENCTNAIAVSGYNYVGGLVGSSNHTLFRGCINRASLSSQPTGWDYGYTGGMSGGSMSDSFINCRNEGAVSSTERYVGGIVGQAREAYIFECMNFGIIAGTTYTGGIGGNIVTGTVELCVNEGEIDGTSSSGSNVGGIAGMIGGNLESSLVMTACHNKATVRGGYPGGIVGSLGWSDLIACKNEGDIYGGNSAGGMTPSLAGTSTITACVNFGNISVTASSGANIGGIYGNQGNIMQTITACYSTGRIDYNTAGQYMFAGGICGRKGYTVIEGCYWLPSVNDLITAGASDVADGSGIYKFGTAGNDTGWPTASMEGWGADFWSSLGSWNDGNPTFPSLYWE